MDVLKIDDGGGDANMEAEKTDGGADKWQLGEPDAAVEEIDPFLDLSADDMSKLDSVLFSEEGRKVLEESVSPSGGNFLVADHMYATPTADTKPEEEEEEEEAVPIRRRSSRIHDHLQHEVATKIVSQNKQKQHCNQQRGQRASSAAVSPRPHGCGSGTGGESTSGTETKGSAGVRSSARSMRRHAADSIDYSKPRHWWSLADTEGMAPSDGGAESGRVTPKNLRTTDSGSDSCGARLVAPERHIRCRSAPSRGARFSPRAPTTQTRAKGRSSTPEIEDNVGTSGMDSDDDDETLGSLRQQRGHELEKGLGHEGGRESSEKGEEDDMPLKKLKAGEKNITSKMRPTKRSRTRPQMKGNTGSGDASSNKKKDALSKRKTEKDAGNSASSSEDSNDDTDSEEDPDRLWCICRKPYGNRFMICCDVCKDWFHGSCVGLTRKQGTQLMSRNHVWHCPRCVEKLGDKAGNKSKTAKDAKSDASKLSKVDSAANVKTDSKEIKDENSQPDTDVDEDGKATSSAEKLSANSGSNVSSQITERVNPIWGALQSKMGGVSDKPTSKDNIVPKGRKTTEKVVKTDKNHTADEKVTAKTDKMPIRNIGSLKKDMVSILRSVKGDKVKGHSVIDETDSETKLEVDETTSVTDCDKNEGDFVDKSVVKDEEVIQMYSTNEEDNAMDCSMDDSYALSIDESVSDVKNVDEETAKKSERRPSAEVPSAKKTSDGKSSEKRKLGSLDARFEKNAHAREERVKSQDKVHRKHRDVNVDGATGGVTHRKHSTDMSEPAHKMSKTLSSCDSTSKKSKEKKKKVPKCDRCIVEGCEAAAKAKSVYCGEGCILRHVHESLRLLEKQRSKTLNSRTERASDGSTEASKLSSERVVVFERRTGKLVTGPAAPTHASLQSWLARHPSFEVLRPGQGAGQSSGLHKPVMKVERERVRSAESDALREKRMANVMRQLAGPEKPPPVPSATAKRAHMRTSTGNRGYEKTDRSSLHHHHHHRAVSTSHHEKISDKVNAPSEDSTPLPSYDPRRQQSHQRTPSSPPSQPLKTIMIDPPHRDPEQEDPVVSSPLPAKPSSGPDPIRITIRVSLKETLQNKAEDADDVMLSKGEIKQLALDIEEQLFKLYGGVTSKYRAKYRSLIFNIKDTKNLGLSNQIFNATLTPCKLVRLTPEELASKQLADWRRNETQHTLDMIELEESMPAPHVTKKTSKGEVDVGEENLSILESRVSYQHEAQQQAAHGHHHYADDHDHDDSFGHYGAARGTDTAAQHNNHLYDQNCSICVSGQRPTADVSGGPRPRRKRVKFGEVPVSAAADDSSTSDVTPSWPPVATTTMTARDESSKTKSKTKSKTTSKVTSNVVSLPDVSPDLDLDIQPVVPSDLEPLAVGHFEWRGNVYIQDMLKFSTIAYKVSGNTEHLEKDLPETLIVQGRIPPTQIWDYIGRVRYTHTSSREISVVRLEASQSAERAGYAQFYSYLSSRQRCAVVSNCGRSVKDMYIVPLAADSMVPDVLMPFDGPGLSVSRPHLLLGIVVTQRAARSAAPVQTSANSTASFNVYTERTELEIGEDRPPAKRSRKDDRTKDMAEVAARHETRTATHSSADDPVDPRTVKITSQPIIPQKSQDRIVKEYAHKTTPNSEADTSGLSPYSPGDSDEPYDPACSSSASSLELTSQKVSKTTKEKLAKMKSSATAGKQTMVTAGAAEKHGASHVTSSQNKPKPVDSSEEQRRLLLDLTRRVEQQRLALEKRKNDIATTTTATAAASAEVKVTDSPKNLVRQSLASQTASLTAGVQKLLEGLRAATMGVKVAEKSAVEEAKPAATVVVPEVAAVSETVQVVDPSPKEQTPVVTSASVDIVEMAPVVTVAEAPAVVAPHVEAPPVAPPVAPSAEAPVAPPAALLVAPPVAPPTAPPMEPSIAPSVVLPVVPPAGPSVAPPIAPPVAPSIAPPMPPSIALHVAPSIAPPVTLSIETHVAPSHPPPVAPSPPPPVAPSLAPPVVPSLAPPVVPPFTNPTPENIIGMLRGISAVIAKPAVVTTSSTTIPLQIAEILGKQTVAKMEPAAAATPVADLAKDDNVDEVTRTMPLTKNPFEISESPQEPQSSNEGIAIDTQLEDVMKNFHGDVDYRSPVVDARPAWKPAFIDSGDVLPMRTSSPHVESAPETVAIPGFAGPGEKISINVSEETSVDAPVVATADLSTLGEFAVQWLKAQVGELNVLHPEVVEQAPASPTQDDDVVLTKVTPAEEIIIGAESPSSTTSSKVENKDKESAERRSASPKSRSRLTKSHSKSPRHHSRRAKRSRSRSPHHRSRSKKDRSRSPRNRRRGNRSRKKRSGSHENWRNRRDSDSRDQRQASHNRNRSPDNRIGQWGNRRGGNWGGRKGNNRQGAQSNDRQRRWSQDSNTSQRQLEQRSDHRLDRSDRKSEENNFNQISDQRSGKMLPQGSNLKLDQSDRDVATNSVPEATGNPQANGSEATRSHQASISDVGAAQCKWLPVKPIGEHTEKTFTGRKSQSPIDRSMVHPEAMPATQPTIQPITELIEPPKPKLILPLLQQVIPRPANIKSSMFSAENVQTQNNLPLARKLPPGSLLQTRSVLLPKSAPQPITMTTTNAGDATIMATATVATTSVPGGNLSNWPMTLVAQDKDERIGKRITLLTTPTVVAVPTTAAAPTAVAVPPIDVTTLDKDERFQRGPTVPPPSIPPPPPPSVRLVVPPSAPIPVIGAPAHAPTRGLLQNPARPVMTRITAPAQPFRQPRPFPPRPPLPQSPRGSMDMFRGRGRGRGHHIRPRFARPMVRPRY